LQKRLEVVTIAPDGRIRRGIAMSEKPVISEKTKTKIIRLAEALFPGTKVYLFGSYACGTQNKYSDIDIAIDTGKPLERFAIDELREIIKASDVWPKVDVVDYQDANESFKEEIDRDKVIWKN
jgi:predicted nucleotidyltransferase